MATDQSIWLYFANAGFVVKMVMLILLAASVISWTIIIQRGIFLKRIRQIATEFEEAFWAEGDLNKLYTDISSGEFDRESLECIFEAGFKEFLRLRKRANVEPAVIMEGVQRAMRIAYAKEIDKLENHLSFLATVGSISPYVGLFGTVWGIMTSLHALGNASQATIAMVAPGISEALVATAMGLFAAIPAVIAYNRYTNEVERLCHFYATFQDELSSIFHRQAHGGIGA
ncbi:MAG: Tol-Pal system protein TolQ [Legionellaceae bacterium]